MGASYRPLEIGVNVRVIVGRRVVRLPHFTVTAFPVYGVFGKKHTEIVLIFDNASLA